VKKLDQQKIKIQLRQLGLIEGDVIFIAADLMRVGYFNKNRDQTLDDWMKILLEVVGRDGTLVIPAFTKFFYRFKKDKNIIFDSTSETTSGALSAAFQKNPNVLRSKHPTNSCFAIGKMANYIVDGHDEKSTSYTPFMRVVELQGKNLMIGALSDERLSPMTIHCAQEYLGITKQHCLAGLLQTYYTTPARTTELFTRWDIGGCTAGGFKTLGHHIIGDAMSLGKVGNATAAYIDCKKSFEIFVKILREEPNLLRCKDKTCTTCYGSPIKKHPIFWLKKVLTKLISKM
jgi:aminoglycoside 3-N-acetyltransferase